MKKAVVAGLLLTLILGAAFSQSVKDYYDSKMQELMKLTLRQDGYFYFSFMPIPAELLILQNYPKWIEKRFNEDRRVEEARKLLVEGNGKIYGVFAVFFKGKWDSKGKTELKIPDDLREYVFIENENEDYWACTKAEIPLMGNTINYFNDNTQIPMEFPFPMELAAGSRKAIFTIGGVQLENTKFEFDLPFAGMFADAPDEAKSIFRKAGVWPE